MYVASSDDSPFFTTLLGLGATPQTVSLRSTCVRNDVDARGIAPRQIAVHCPGHVPSFDDVFGLALTAAQIGQRVVALCMREHIFRDWQRRLDECALSVPRFDLLDAYSASPTDWAEFLAHQAYDIIIFHGIRSALASHNLPLSHAKRLVDAISAGLIVLA